jgi:hypothetical protein
MDDRSRYRVVKQFEKPRGAAPLAVSANDGVQRGLRAEDADGLPEPILPSVDDSRELVSRNDTGVKKKTSPANASRSIVIKIVLDQV